MAFVFSSARTAILAASLLVAGCALQHQARVDGGADAPNFEGGDRIAIDGDVPIAPDALDVTDVIDVETDAGCVAPRAMCTAGCIDPQTDLSNCGSCENACAPHANATANCVAGACGMNCNPGFADCDGNIANGCEANLSDPANCGACGITCSGGTPVCAQGTTTNTCSSGCGVGQERCTNSCVDVAIDASNCGRCGNVCAAAHGTPGCAGGNCTVLACETGYADCNGNAADGCEVNTTSSTMNCGACGTVCPGGANAAAACVSGSCRLNCTGSFRNCDTTVSNGCEVNAGNDVSNCGMCGTVCSFPNAAASCSGGTCVRGNCNASFRDCDGAATNGCEANIQTSLANCGACGTVCPSRCNAGVCQIPTSCAQLHMLNTMAPSGRYSIDPDGGGGMAAITVYCDMDTANGGWTVIFDNSGMTGFDSDNVAYTVNNGRIRMDANEALIAYRDASNATLDSPARFPLPNDWQMASPFSYQNSTVSVAVTIGGNSSNVNLRYGYAGFNGGCGSNWTGGGHVGRVCVEGTAAPFFNAFADNTGDFCSNSDQGPTTTACSASRHFTIAVR